MHHLYVVLIILVMNLCTYPFLYSLSFWQCRSSTPVKNLLWESSLLKSVGPLWVHILSLASIIKNILYIYVSVMVAIFACLLNKVHFGWIKKGKLFYPIILSRLTYHSLVNSPWISDRWIALDQGSKVCNSWNFPCLA